MQESLHQLPGLRGRQTQTRRGDVDAGDESNQIDADRSKTSFIEIVQIEIAQPVVAFERTEILQMQITAKKHARCFEQSVAARQRLQKKRVGAAEEGERVLPQSCELERQPIEVAAGVLR